MPGAGFAKPRSGLSGARFANGGDVMAAGWLRIGIGYGVVEAVVEAIVGTTLVGTIGRGHSNSF